MKKQKIPSQLSPEKFLFELYIGRVGYAVNQVIDSFDQVKPGFKILGYCDARRLRVRPRIEGFAIMVEDTQLPEQTQFWLHVERIKGITPTKPPAKSVPLPETKVKDSYTKDEFNKAYCDFRMEKMGNKKAMEDLPGIMRAYRALLHIYINTDRVANDKMVKIMMEGLQTEFYIRLAYMHGPLWMTKEGVLT